MRTRAVVFDLFDTLVLFGDDTAREYTAAAAEVLARDPDEFERVWRQGREARDSGPLLPYLASLGLADEEAGRLLELRRAFARKLLASPREGALETLRELRARRLRVGLITVCSEDAVDVWPESPFAGCFDSEVFSCSVGLRKPDPRIYALACEELGVEPQETLFVGDGANDELAGAERAGMRALLIHREGREPSWPEARAWPGPRITAIPQVLEHL